MAYTILNDNPCLVPEDADVVVYYDNTKKEKKFLVGSTDRTLGCLLVSIEELNSDIFKYPSEVIEGILSKTLPEDEDFLVYLTNRTRNAIHLVCQANRITF